MATVMHMRWTGITPEQYDTLREMVQWEEVPAEGGLLHIAGFDADGIRVTDVWDSQEQCLRFVETRLMPAVREAAIQGQPDVEFSELHAVWSPKVELALT